MKVFKFGCLGVIGLGLLLIVFGMFGAGGDDSPRPVDDVSACVAAKKFVTDRLKSPSTAEYPACTEGRGTYVSNNGNSWTVRSHVDSQNSFGAMIRTDFTAAMTYNRSSDSWQLTNLTTNP